MRAGTDEVRANRVKGCYDGAHHGAFAELFRIDTSKIVSALKPYGPTPIVTTVVGVAALAALSAHADSVAVLVVVILVLAAHIWGLERKADLRRKELEVEFDAKQQIEGERVLGPLRLRLRQKQQAQQQPSLFDREENG